MLGCQNGGLGIRVRDWLRMSGCQGQGVRVGFKFQVSGSGSGCQDLGQDVKVSVRMTVKVRVSGSVS